MKIISATACKEPVSVIIEYEDGRMVCAPFYDGNSDYENYKAWLAEGNTPNPYVPPPPAVPAQVPMWAVRTVLQNDGLFEQAQALITASSDNGLKNVWEYGNFADRNSKSIMSLATALGLTSEQVDQMFVDANNLTV